MKSTKCAALDRTGSDRIAGSAWPELLVDRLPLAPHLQQQLRGPLRVEGLVAHPPHHQLLPVHLHPAPVGRTHR